MTSPLRSPEDYEIFLYSLSERYPSIRRSTVALTRRGHSLARVTGEISFNHGIRLVVLERLVFDRRPMSIEAYGYEIWRDEEKLYWYDPQPHPNDPGLQSTHPHHKHVPPDIKHNRIQAPEMSFVRPNLPALISEIEELIQRIEAPSAP
jgi:Family of unknown function (DUF6516)